MTDVAPGPPEHQTTGSLRRLYLGEGFSYFGDGIQLIALPTAFVLTSSSGLEATRAIGTVLAISVASRLLGLAAGGFMADRLRPHQMMIAADLVRAMIVCVQAISFGSGRTHLGVLAGCAFVMGTSSGVSSPAFRALVRRVTDDGNRVRANSVLSIIQTSTTLVSPPVGGVLVAWAGPVSGLLVNAATFVVSAVALMGIAGDNRVSRNRSPHRWRKTLTADFVQGWQEIAAKPWLSLTIVSSTVLNTVIGLLVILANVRVLNQLGGAKVLGVITAAEALGGLLGAFTAQKIAIRHPLRIGCFLLALISITFGSYALTDRVVLIAAASIVGFAGVALFAVSWESLLQFHVRPENIGKVTAWDMVGSYLGQPLGQVFAAELALHFGVDRIMIVGAVCIVLFSMLPLVSKSSRTLELRPLSDRNVEDDHADRDGALADS